MILATKAPAKINLFLDVTAKRADGYHDIRSIMQTVDLCDTVTVESLDAATGEAEISLTCSDSALPCDEKNLAHKAATAFFGAVGMESYSCRIHIDKVIPMEAGLAGGSSDAAAVLRLLNELYGSPLSQDELCKAGASVGADVPFCIVGGTCLCEGIGEMLTQLPPMPDSHIVVARGGKGVSTPVAYRMVDERWDNNFSVSGGDFEKISSALSVGDLCEIADGMYNIFEDVILPGHPVASRLKEIMVECGAIGAMMSGSGPSVFGLFLNKDDAEVAVEKAGEISRSFCCTPLGF